MIYLLDTNACIVYLNRPMYGVRQKIQSLSPQDVAVCSVVKAELFYGAMRSNNTTRTLALQEAFLNNFVSLPFDDSAATIYGRIRAELAAIGTPIGPYDLQIAAIAMANNLILVTHNTREYGYLDLNEIKEIEVLPEDLEKDLDQELTRFCKDKGITVEVFLEAAWTFASADNALLEKVTTEAKRRYDQRKRVGQIKRLITMLSNSSK
ncbi:PIN domain-containing protein [Nostoc sp.]